MEKQIRKPLSFFVVSKTAWNDVMRELEELRRREKRTIDLKIMAEVTLQDLKDVFAFCHETKSRIANVAELRHFARFFLRSNTTMRLKKIAVMTNCRDHTTILHSVNKVSSDIQIYENIERRYTGFELRITNDLQDLINERNGINRVQEVATESVSVN